MKQLIPPGIRRGGWKSQNGLRGEGVRYGRGFFSCLNYLLGQPCVHSALTGRLTQDLQECFFPKGLGRSGKDEPQSSSEVLALRLAS